MTTGYKWTQRKSDKKTFYVTLTCFDEYPDNPHSYSGNAFYTTNCIIERIEDDQGNTVKSIDGHAFRDFVYTVGERITGQKIFYVKDLEYIKRHCPEHYSQFAEKQVKRLEAWNAAADKAMQNPLFFYSPDIFDSLRENYFFEAGFTVQDLLLLHEDDAFA